MVELSEKWRRVDPSRRCPTQLLLYPQLGTLKCVFYFILLDSQFPYDSFIGENMCFNFREDKFAYQIVLIYKSVWLKEIFKFKYYA